MSQNPDPTRWPTSLYIGPYISALAALGLSETTLLRIAVELQRWAYREGKSLLLDMAVDIGRLVRERPEIPPLEEALKRIANLEMPEKHRDVIHYGLSRAVSRLAPRIRSARPRVGSADIERITHLLKAIQTGADSVPGFSPSDWAATDEGAEFREFSTISGVLEERLVAIHDLIEDDCKQYSVRLADHKDAFERWAKHHVKIFLLDFRKKANEHFVEPGNRRLTNADINAFPPKVDALWRDCRDKILADLRLPTWPSGRKTPPSLPTKLPDETNPKRKKLERAKTFLRGVGHRGGGTLAAVGTVGTVIILGKTHAVSVAGGIKLGLLAGSALGGVVFLGLAAVAGVAWCAWNLFTRKKVRQDMANRFIKAAEEQERALVDSLLKFFDELGEAELVKVEELLLGEARPHIAFLEEMQDVVAQKLHRARQSSI